MSEAGGGAGIEAVKFPRGRRTNAETLARPYGIRFAVSHGQGQSKQPARA